MPNLPKRDRARRNRPAGGEWTAVPDGAYDGPRPRKPSGLRSFASHCWDAYWLSPVANMWEDDDRLEVVRLVKLLDKSDRDEDCPGWVHSEIRHGQERLGLTRKGRLSNRYDLPDAESDGDGRDEPVDDLKSKWGHLEPVEDLA